jgi:hypothetical protein
MAKDTEVNVERSRVRIGRMVYEDHGVFVGEQEWAFRSRKWAFLKGQKRRINELDEAEREQARPVWVPVYNEATIDLLDELLYEARRKARGEVLFDEYGRQLCGHEEGREEKDGTESPSAEASEHIAAVSSGQDTRPFQLWLVDPNKPHPYVKTSEGAWGFIKWSRGKFHPRKRLERHKAAELNRELLRRAIIQKVETPEKPPASFNKLLSNVRRPDDPGKRCYIPINLVQSREHPAETTMFWRRAVMGTTTTDSLERFALNILRYCAERRLWEAQEGLQPTEAAEEDEQDESQEDAVEEEEL